MKITLHPSVHQHEYLAHAKPMERLRNFDKGFLKSVSQMIMETRIGLLVTRHIRNFWTDILFKGKKPLSSQVLTSYLLQTDEPSWTSYFVRYADVMNDQCGMSHFNWPAGNSNYHVLRTGCFPYIKYHCSKRPIQDLSSEDKFFKAIKILNLGIPTLLYGLAATQLIRHREIVKTPQGDVTIYFLLPEDKGSRY